LAGCVPEAKVPVPSEDIVQTIIAGQTFRIPKNYLYKSNPEPVDDSAMILVMYPDFKPPTERPNDLWKRGEWYRNIRILFADLKTMKSLDTILKNRIARLETSRIIGEEYGLIYQTQEEENPKDWGELWVEQEGYPAYIECSSPKSGNPILRCKHVMNWKNLYIHLSYDKKFLPHWQAIKDNVIRILEEFEVESSDNPMKIME
jgi:hypothetical protein